MQGRKLDFGHGKLKLEPHFWYSLAESPQAFNHLEPHYISFFLKKFILFIYLFLAVLGLRCCGRAFSNCSERRLLFIAVRGLLIVVASLVAEHGL